MTTDAHRQALIHGERVGEAWALVPPRRMQLLTGGAHQGRRAGGSLEFRDYRDYQPGDDLRHLDWNVFARSDKLAVKQFREEVSPFVELILDSSRSMALADSTKSEIALALTAMIATAARNASFPYSLSLAADHVSKPADATASPSEWNAIAFDFAGDPAAALMRATSLLRPFSVRVLVTDLLWPADPSPLLQALAHEAAAVVIIEVLAAADARPPISGDNRIVDSETNDAQDIVFDDRAAAAYNAALVRHHALWDAAARESGSIIVRCIAEDLSDDLMFDDLAAAEILKPAWSRS